MRVAGLLASKTARFDAVARTLALVLVAGCLPDGVHTSNLAPRRNAGEKDAGGDADAAQGQGNSADAGTSPPGNPDPVVLLFAAGRTSGALTARGRALFWGRDVALPYVTNTYDPPPPRIEALTGLPPVVDLAFGSYVWCLLDTQGQVYCRPALGIVGEQADFARIDLPAVALHLGTASTPIALIEPGDEIHELSGSQPSPPVFLPETVSMLCSAGNFDIALGQSKLVYEWGSSQRPSLGLMYLSGPRAIPDLPAARQIACGFDHACSLGEQGQVSCWGGGSGGQLGREVRCGNPSNCGFEPAHVDLDDTSPVVRIAASGNRSAALTEAGNLYLWGGHQSDSCRGGMPCSHSPVLAPLPAAAREVALGDDHVCVLLEDRRVFCWGDNTYRQANPADLSSQTVAQPIQVLP